MQVEVQEAATCVRASRSHKGHGAANAQAVRAGRIAAATTTVHVPGNQLPPAAPTASPSLLVVADCDTASAALTLARRGPPPALLNFASATQCGGGYVTGALAQEEDLCRVIPALHPALLQLRYPLDAAAVPTTWAAICRQPVTYTTLPVPAPVVILTAAAVDLRGAPTDSAAYGAAMRPRIRAVLSAAVAAGCQDLVLGAWGCGVFRNDARLVVSLFAEALASPEWRHRFASVVFAVPRGRSAAVHRIFLDGLQPLTR